MTGHGVSGTLPERSPSTGISVLIIGGGIAGLLAALECWRKGHDVQIVERSAERNQSGDVLTVGQSAVRATKRWPDMAVENENITHEMWISWHKINGDLLSGPAQLRPNDPKKKSENDPVEPTPKILRHRRQGLHNMLADQVERAGMEVQYGKQVLKYREDDSKAYAVLSSGGEMEADIVIAADGIGSKSYRITLGHEVRAKATGFSMYRAMLPIDQALVDPIIDEKFPALDNKRASNQMWMGDNVYVLFGRTEADVIWYITYPNRGSSEESWSNLADPETVLETTATIKDWPDYANRLIKATRKDQIHDFKLMWRDPQPCWVSPKGRVVQIGDAAHTFLPSSGHGATQGMEDAVSLAACLQLGGKERVPLATRVHNKLRFERVSCLQLLGILNHELRNRAANADASQAKPIGIMGSWIWQHDPERYANENYEKAVAHLTEGKEFKNTNIPPGHVHEPWTIDGILKAREEGKHIVLDGDWD